MTGNATPTRFIQSHSCGEYELPLSSVQSVKSHIKLIALFTHNRVREGDPQFVAGMEINWMNKIFSEDMQDKRIPLGVRRIGTSHKIFFIFRGRLMTINSGRIVPCDPWME